MSKFITVDGATYFSTPNVNLLPADTGNVEQSIGHWAANTGTSTPSLSSDFAYTGTNAVKFVCNGTHARCAATTVGSGNVAVTDSVEQNIGVWLYTASADREAFMTPLGYTDTAYIESYGIGDVVALTQNDWTWVPHTIPFTPSVGVDNLNMRLNYRVASTDANAPNGDVFYIGASSLRTGANAAWFPSTNIQGTIDLRAKVAVATGFSTDHRWMIGQTDLSMVGFGFHIATGGNALVSNVGDGATMRTQTAAVTPAVGVPTEWKYVMDTAGALTWYKNGNSFDTDTPGAGAAAPSSNDLFVCRYPTVDIRMFVGDIHYVEIRDGDDGPVVATVNAADPTTVGDSDTWVDETGRTWTVVGAGASIGYTERNPHNLATPGQLLRTGG